ncbi:MAG: hypothetical protein KBG15_17655 [Kofleriaceae bacterium]|nr:hypothetical protein [Kofleriaceae bacterium]
MRRAVVSRGLQRGSAIAATVLGLVTDVRSLCVVPATAQPAPTSSSVPCAVKLRRADPVFAEALLAHIRDLGGCKVALDVYIVKTDGGYYLLVRDSLGRMQDRVVPSLQLAATLIASFAESSVELPPVRVTPAFDAERPEGNSQAAAGRVAEPIRTGNGDFGRATILAQAGAFADSIGLQAVELQVDLGRLASSVVAAVAVSLQHDFATAPVMRTDAAISSFVARRDGGWGTGYLRYRSERRLALEPILGLSVGYLEQRRVIATTLPGYVVEYQQETALAIRMSGGALASYGFDPHVRLVVQVQALAGTATVPGGGIDVAWLGGVGLRYTP